MISDRPARSPEPGSESTGTLEARRGVERSRKTRRLFSRPVRRIGPPQSQWPAPVAAEHGDCKLAYVLVRARAEKVEWSGATPSRPIRQNQWQSEWFRQEVKSGLRHLIRLFRSACTSSSGEEALITIAAIKRWPSARCRLPAVRLSAASTRSTKA